MFGFCTVCAGISNPITVRYIMETYITIDLKIMFHEGTSDSITDIVAEEQNQ